MFKAPLISSSMENGDRILGKDSESLYPSGDRAGSGIIDSWGWAWWLGSLNQACEAWLLTTPPLLSSEGRRTWWTSLWTPEPSGLYLNPDPPHPSCVILSRKFIPAQPWLLYLQQKIKWGYVKCLAHNWGQVNSSHNYNISVQTMHMLCSPRFQWLRGTPCEVCLHLPWLKNQSWFHMAILCTLIWPTCKIFHLFPFNFTYLLGSFNSDWWAVFQS